MSSIWKCMSEIWGIPSPKIGAQKTTFFDYLATYRQFLRLMCSERNTTYVIGQVRWNYHKGSPTSSQNVMNFGQKGIKIGPPFYPPSANSAFYFTRRTIVWHWIAFMCWCAVKNLHTHFAHGDQQTKLNQTLPNAGQ